MQIRLDDVSEQQITQCLDLLKDIYDQDLLGVYLYGSATLGGLQVYSDIDLMAVTRRPATRAEKAAIAAALLEISGVYPISKKRSVELTLVVGPVVNPWHYPPAFDFQYGDWLRESFEQGTFTQWEPAVSPDLAILITQVLLASKTVFGPPPEQLLQPVPYGDFISASTDGLDSLLADLEPDTRNVLLTLARIWCTLETGAIRSKHGAAAWVIDKLPPEYRPVMARARAVYLGEHDPGWDDLRAMIRPCAGFIVTNVKAQAASLHSSSGAPAAIHLGD